MPTVLLTSFQTWLPHQPSNSSDDLLALLAAEPVPDLRLHYLRQLPVEAVAASRLTLKAIRQRQPDWVVCCGMAESRAQLSLEARARCGDRQHFAPVDVAAIAGRLRATTVSHDAGRFVCEGLYFAALEELSRQASRTRVLFLHVPVLTPHNQRTLLADVRGLLALLPTL